MRRTRGEQREACGVRKRRARRVRDAGGGGCVGHGGWAAGFAGPGRRCHSRPRGSQVQAQLQLDSAVAHAHHHLHPHLAHAPYMMFPAPPFGLPLATLAESASAASVVAAAAAAKTTSKNSSIADLRLKAKKHAAALGL